jgi:hypothetical protein
MGTGFGGANEGDEWSLLCTGRFAVEVVSQDAFVMSLFG